MWKKDVMEIRVRKSCDEKIAQWRRPRTLLAKRWKCNSRSSGIGGAAPLHEHHHRELPSQRVRSRDRRIVLQYGAGRCIEKWTNSIGEIHAESSSDRRRLRGGNGSGCL